MLNRTLALSLLSVSLYGAYISEVRIPLGFGKWQSEKHTYNHTELLAQEVPSNSAPHRGSGRCDQSC